VIGCRGDEAIVALPVSEDGFIVCNLMNNFTNVLAGLCFRGSEMTVPIPSTPGIEDPCRPNRP
jgi:hypothetical protein